MATGFHQAAQPFPSEEVRLQLRRILISHTFADSDRLRALLSWLVEESLAGHSERLKESLIGLEVFHRAPSWDPQNDAIVRVQVHNLRRLLDNYYQTEGKADPLTIEIPKGAYVPLVSRRSAPAWRSRLLLAAACCFIAGLVLTAGVLYSRRQAQSAPPTLAVLAFENLTGDTSQDYVARGVCAELTAMLAHSKQIRVTDSAAMPAYGDDSYRAAAALHVRYILTGSVRRAQQPGTWSVTARLIDSTTGRHVWSNHFQRPAATLESLPAEIAVSVLSALGATQESGP